MSRFLKIRPGFKVLNGQAGQLRTRDLLHPKH